MSNNVFNDLLNWFESLFKVIAKSFAQILKDMFSKKSFIELGEIALPVLRKNILAMMEDDTISNSDKRETVFTNGVEELTSLGIEWTESAIRAAIEIIYMDLKEVLDK